MKSPYSTIFCHGKDCPSLRQSSLLRHSIYFQWNEPILRPICEEFLKRAVSDGSLNSITAEDTLVVHGAHLAPHQPVWKLEPEGETKEKHKHSQEANQASKRDCESAGPLSFTAHEKIAWYCPAHFHLGEKIRDYGIHFDVAKVVGMAKSLSEKVPAASSPEIQDADWVLLAFVTCIWHEVCHGWVEDLCCLAEGVTGFDYYTETHRRYGSYIIMEEALCNTSAHGMLRVFYGREDDDHDIKPDILCQLTASTDWMRSQPPGYSDFAPISWWSAHNAVFLLNMQRLLEEVYGVPQEVATHVMRVFFEFSEISLPCPQGALPHGLMHDGVHKKARLCTEQYMVHFSYPTHTHPDLDEKLPQSYLEMRKEDRWTLWNFLRTLDGDELVERYGRNRDEKWKEFIAKDFPFYAKIQDENLQKTCEALIALAVGYEEVPQPQPVWQQAVIEAIHTQIPGADAKPDSYRPDAVFVGLPGSEDLQGRKASWEERLTRLEEILEQAKVPHGDLEEINNYNHIRINPKGG